MKRNEKCQLLEVTAERTIGGKQDYQTFEIFGTNPKYAFALRRNTSTSPWTVSQLIDRSNNKLPPAFEDHFDTFQRGNNQLVKVSRKYPLVEVIRKPQFRVVRCRRVQQDGDDLVEVVFDYPHKVEKGGNDIQRGTLLLDPQRFWCLRSFEIQKASEVEGYRGTEQFQVLELGETDQSLPVPKRAVTKNTVVFDNGIGNTQEWRFEYDLSVPRRLPDDDEFTLTAFGLPEPPGLEWKGPTRWYLWVGLAGIVCLVLGAAIHRFRRRKAASA